MRCFSYVDLGIHNILSAALRFGRWLKAAVLLNQLIDFIPQLLMVDTHRWNTLKETLVKAFISSLFQLQKHLLCEYHYLPKLHQHFIEYTCPYCKKPTCHGSRSKVPFQHLIDWAWIFYREALQPQQFSQLISSTIHHVLLPFVIQLPHHYILS